MLLPLAKPVNRFSVSFLGSNSQDGDAASYTITAAALGRPEPNRKIAVAFLGAGNVTATGVTRGGVSATAISGAVATQPASSSMYIYEATVPNGSTGDIVVTFSGSAVRFGAGWWRIVNGKSSGGAGAIGTAVNTLPITIAIPTGGVGLYACYQFVNGAFNAWNELTTEDFDTVMEAAGRAITGGRRTTAGLVAVTANWTTAAANNPNLVGCAYGPL